MINNPLHHFFLRRHKLDIKQNNTKNDNRYIEKLKSFYDSTLNSCKSQSIESALKRIKVIIKHMNSFQTISIINSLLGKDEKNKRK